MELGRELQKDNQEKEHTNKRSGLFQLDEKGYSELIYAYSMEELKGMLQSGEILEIKRYGSN
ncbi:MAG TPA: hypothetical protein VIT44_02430 [Cyclobacteriaceae bacterium]